jgi:hypothetical protein
MPYQVLLVRGTVRTDTVEGIAPEYAAVTKRRGRAEARRSAGRGRGAGSAVADGTFPYPPASFAANVPPDRVAAELTARGRPADAIVTPYTCLVAETGRHRVLVDTVIGPLPRACRTPPGGGEVGAQPPASTRPRSIPSSRARHRSSARTRRS